MAKVTFKTSDGREIAEEDAQTELVRLMKKRQSQTPGMAFAAARDEILGDEPVLAKAWLGVDED